MTDIATAAPCRAAEPVPFGEAFRIWVKIGLLSFGGPAGQIAVMHRILVEEKRWIGENRFLHALNYCMLLPGPKRRSSPFTSAGCCTRRKAASSPGFSSSCPASSPSWP